MEIISRRVLSSTQTEVYVDLINSFLTKAIDSTNVYLLKKFDQPCNPRPSLNQNISNTLPQ